MDAAKLVKPHIRLNGEVDDQMLRAFTDQLNLRWRSL